VISTRRERSLEARAKAIELYGTRCQGCGFDFGDTYSAWGKGYIEVHHVAQLASVQGHVETNPATDLTVLCANCHRMASTAQHLLDA
jgi:5-methylcytosine-specific restriction enzyme A